MRIALAIALAVHGLAHLVGFLIAWQLIHLPEQPYKTTILGDRVDVGDVGARVMGLWWLAGTVAFVVVAAATILEAPWSGLASYWAIGCSGLLCIIGWPDARLGVAANIGLAAILVAGDSGWL